MPELEYAVARVLILPAAGDTGPLDYSIPTELHAEVRIGVRVIVPLGQRRAVGMVVELLERSELKKLRAIGSVIEPRPMVDAPLLQLCHWLADYYLCSFSDAVTNALPGSLRMKMEQVVSLVPIADGSAAAELKQNQGELVDHLHTTGEQTLTALTQRFGTAVRATITALRRRKLVVVESRLRPATGRSRHVRYFRIQRMLAGEELEQWMKRRPASFGLYSYLAEHPLKRAMLKELEGSFPNAADTLRRLQRDGVVAVVEEEVLRQVLPEAPPKDRPVTLSESQRVAVAAIVAAESEGFAPFLLWGVTGSGKTEVYLNSIAACFAAGRSALVMVPEISLTHQIIDRIRARFDRTMAVLHSGLNDGERWDEWRRIAAGDVDIVVGARSAIFAPLPNLGLIIVDEEHDSAYKQDDGVRYNGRDAAVVRAKLAGCPVVLGSATPALESFLNARNGRYRLLELPERVASRPLPSIELVDLRRSGPLARAALVSPLLRAALTANLTGGQQSLVFLNRRGFANFLQCHECGEALQCPNCSVSLTLHQRWQALRCHHCDYTIRIPSSCPHCGGIALGQWGAGTEQVEEALSKLIPGARMARLDRDTTLRKGRQREILSSWERGEKDILVGTQMITKGHDVHAVTLVGVLLADSALNFPDFRAAERTFQTLAQVAGRAGRGTQPGRVIIQTYQPEHPSLKFATHHDYAGFAAHELAARRELGFPPYGRLVQIRCEGEQPDATERIAQRFKDALTPAPAGIKVTGPGLAPLEKVRRRHRWQLLLRGTNSNALRRAAHAGREAVRAEARAAEVRVIVDVDPYSML